MDCIFFRTFALEKTIRDDNIDNRIIDSPVGNYARLDLRLFHEERHVAEAAKVVTGLCLGGDGSGIGLVAADSFDGDSKRQRTLVGNARCLGIFVGNVFSAVD